MFGLPLPRGGPFIIGSADDQDCDLIIDSPSVAPRHLRLELITCGARGRVARHAPLPASAVHALMPVVPEVRQIVYPRSCSVVSSLVPA